MKHPQAVSRLLASLLIGTSAISSAAEPSTDSRAERRSNGARQNAGARLHHPRAARQAHQPQQPRVCARRPALRRRLRRTFPYWKEAKADVYHYSTDKRRGCLLRIAPDGKVEQLASGLRYVMSLQWNRHGDLFGTDQEGATWVPNGNSLRRTPASPSRPPLRLPPESSRASASSDRRAKRVGLRPAAPEHLRLPLQRPAARPRPLRSGVLSPRRPHHG